MYFVGIISVHGAGLFVAVSVEYLHWHWNSVSPDGEQVCPTPHCADFFSTESHRGKGRP
jgi:hypothetical protein